MIRPLGATDNCARDIQYLHALQNYVTEVVTSDNLIPISPCEPGFGELVKLWPSATSSCGGNKDSFDI